MDKVLIDTSAWVDFFTRSASRAAGVVDRLLEEERGCVTGVVMAELLRRARSAQARDLLLATLQSLMFLETTRDIWMASGSLAASLSQAGRSLPLTDIVIAAVAHAYDCAIYTTDAHFNHIPHVKLYPG